MGFLFVGTNGADLGPEENPNPIIPPPDILVLNNVNWTEPENYSGLVLERSTTGWFVNEASGTGVLSETLMAVPNQPRPLWVDGNLIGTYVEPASRQEADNPNFEGTLPGVSTPGGTGSAPDNWTFTGAGAYVLTWSSVYTANSRPAVNVRIQASTATTLTLNMLPMGFHAATTTSGQSWAITWEARISGNGLLAGQSTFLGFRQYTAADVFTGQNSIAVAWTSSPEPQRLTRTSITTNSGVAGFDGGFVLTKSNANALDITYTFYSPPQLEKQAFATSPMLSGFFQRGAERGIIPLALANYSGDTGVTYASVYFTSTSGAGERNILSLSDASGVNVVETLISGSQNLVGSITAGTEQARATALTSTKAEVAYTIGVAFALNSAGVAATGGTIKVDNTVDVPANLTTMTIGPFPGAVVATFIEKPRPSDADFIERVGAVAGAAPENPPPDPEDPPPEEPAGPAFFVAPATYDPPGSDSNPGTNALPFLTIAKALQAAAVGPAKEIYLHEGHYYLSADIDLTSAHNNVKIYNYPSEIPVVHGGTKVTGWTAIGGGLFEATAAHPGVDLTVGGMRYVPSQKPARVDHGNGTHTDDWFWCDARNDGGNQRGGFRYRGTDLTAADVVSGQTLVETFHTYRYRSQIMQASSLNTSTKLLTMVGLQNTAQDMSNAATYRLLCNPGYITDGGEFAYNASNGKIRLKPVNSATFEDDGGVVVARLGKVFNLVGCTGVDIIGLVISDTLNANRSYNPVTQTTVHGFGAVWMENCTSCRVASCLIKNAGNGVMITGGSGNTVAHNEICYIGENGVQIGRPTSSSSNKVYANNFHDIGLGSDKEGACVWIQGGGSSNRVAHNYGQDLSRFFCIYCFGLPHPTNTVVEYNKGLRGMRDTGDGGMIYGFGGHLADGAPAWESISATVRGNFMEDNGSIFGVDLFGATTGTLLYNKFVENFDYPYYLDGFLSGVTMTGNFGKKFGAAGLIMNSGRSNTVTNNFFILDNPITPIAEGGPNQFGADLAAKLNASYPDFINNVVSKNVWDNRGGVATTRAALNVSGTIGSLTRADNVVRALTSGGLSSPTTVVADTLWSGASVGDWRLVNAAALAEGIVDLEWTKMGFVAHAVAAVSGAFHTGGYVNADTTTYPNFWGTIGEYDVERIRDGAYNIVEQRNLPDTGL
jgi:parallel beta-helix repeat protein